MTHNILTLDLGNHKPKLILDKIHEALGYTKAPPPGMDEIIQSALTMAQEACEFKAGYGLFPVEYLSTKSLKIGGLEISPAENITPRLQQAEQVAFFVITIGRAIEKWTCQSAAAREPALSYIIDRIGSLLVEETAEILHAHLADKMQKRGYAVSNRYSPGYCGWDVMDQKILFQLLPKDFCGISLSESAFMRPRKSVSGLIGIGRRIRFYNYNCKTCKNKLCLLAAKQKEQSET